MTPDEVRQVIERLSADPQGGLPTAKEVAEAANVDESRVRQILKEIRSGEQVPQSYLESRNQAPLSRIRVSTIMLVGFLMLSLGVFLVAMINLTRKASVPVAAPVPVERDLARIESAPQSTVNEKEPQTPPDSRWPK